jgi:integrase
MLDNSNFNINLSTISDDWLMINKNKFKQSTYQGYKYKIEKYIKNHYIFTLSVTLITDNDIINFVNTLVDKDLSSKTINDIISVINALFNFIEKRYKINHIEVPYVKNDYKEMRVLTISEQKILEEYLYQNMDNYKFGVYIALYTGIRIGELCALKWSDINNGAININKTVIRLKDGTKTKIVIDSPKTNNSYRSIPIPDFLNEIIETHRKTPDQYVLSSDKISFVEPRLMQIHFKKIISDCNIYDASFHTLRHTFATRCVECGFDIKSLSEILGHSNVQITLNKYVHSSMELKQINMNKLQKIAV